MFQNQYIVSAMAMGAVCLTSVSVAQAQEMDAEAKSSLVAGFKAYNEGNYEEALSQYTLSLSKQATGMGFFSRAAARMRMRQFSEALQDAKKASEISEMPLDPESAASNKKLMEKLERVLKAEEKRNEGVGALVDGRVQEAIETLNASLEVQAQAVTFYDIGRAYCELNDSETARQFGLKAQEEKSFPLTEEEVPKVELLMDNCGKDVDPGSISWLTPVGGGVAVLGGGLLIGAGVMGTQASTVLTELNDEKYDSKTDYNNKLNTLNDTRTTGQLLLYSGAALAVVGIGLVVVDLVTPNAVESAPPQEGDAAEETAFAPAWWLDVAPGRAAAGVGWRF